MAIAYTKLVSLFGILSIVLTFPRRHPQHRVCAHLQGEQTQQANCSLAAGQRLADHPLEKRRKNLAGRPRWRMGLNWKRSLRMVAVCHLDDRPSRKRSWDGQPGRNWADQQSGLKKESQRFHRLVCLATQQVGILGEIVASLTLPPKLAKPLTPNPMTPWSGCSDPVN